MFKKVKKILPIMCACLLLFGSCFTVSAAELNDDWASTINLSGIFLDQSYDYIVVLGNDTRYVVYFSESPAYVYGSSSNSISINRNVENSNECGTCVSYVSTNGYEWTFDRSFENEFYNIALYTYDYIYTNHDIKNLSGDEVVFQGPLTLVELALPLTEAVKMNSIMILPIAVFCLASLVGLTVLSKKLPVFLH